MSDQARNRFLSELLKKVHKGKRQVFCEDQNTYYLQLNTKEQEALGLGERVSVRKLIAMFILGNSTRLKVFFRRGSVKWNFEPKPGEDSAQIRPPWASTMDFAM